jgi:hypothetical protein
MSNQEIVFVVPVNITKIQLVNIILVLNKFEFPEDPLTIEEVLSNPELLKYICTEAAEDGTALFDPFEFWNNDGWCDIFDYR